MSMLTLFPPGLRSSSAGASPSTAASLRTLPDNASPAQHAKALAMTDQTWGKLIDVPRELIDAVGEPKLAIEVDQRLRGPALFVHDEPLFLLGFLA